MAAELFTIFIVHVSSAAVRCDSANQNPSLRAIVRCLRPSRRAAGWPSNLGMAVPFTAESSPERATWSSRSTNPRPSAFLEARHFSSAHPIHRQKTGRCRGSRTKFRGAFVWSLAPQRFVGPKPPSGGVGLELIVGAALHDPSCFDV